MSSDRNKAIAVLCAAGVAVMVGLSFASVPLYQMFCNVTGYGGTTRVAVKPAQTVERTIRVHFDSNVDPRLPWRFEPDQPFVDVKLGEPVQVSYRARNLSDRRITGTATYNVTPYALGLYFNKIQCFCFTSQTLEPGQEIHMPVIFFVDPDMLKDRTSRSITTATLSYTFYESTAAKSAAAR